MPALLKGLPGPGDVFRSFWRHRHLILRLARREIALRYRGSVLGAVWSVITPLIMLAIYTFVFSVVLGVRWNVETPNRWAYAVVLFCGLIVFYLFSECFNRAPNLIQENPSYVKKVVFPLEILPWVALLSSSFNFLVSLAVLLAVLPFVFGAPPLTILLLPLVIIPYMLMIVGLMWLMASLGVFLEDVRHISTMVTTVLMFLTPILYPVEIVPERFRFFLQLNPLSPGVDFTRQVVIWGQVPNLLHWALFCLGSLFMAWLGLAWFQKTRKGFADVL